MATPRPWMYRLAVDLVVIGLVVGGIFLFLQDRGDDVVAVPPEGQPSHVSDFALLDHNGAYHRLYDYRGRAKAVVLYTHLIGCPTVRANMAEFQKLRDRFRSKGVEFLMINAYPHDDREALRKEAKTYKADFPILRDDTRLVTEQLAANRTGEAILIDTKTWKVQYRGPIDDRISDFGVAARDPTEHYLADAIKKVIRGKEVPVAYREAVGTGTDVGCLINLETASKQTISYADDVVPILRDKCMTCHRPNDVAPWSMDSYDTIKGWTPMMREVIMTKRMPPWSADPHIGEFLYDRHLTVEEQRTLVDWIDAGAPPGDKPDPLADNPPKPAEEWPLGEPDLVLTAPLQKIPANGTLDYRYAKIPMPVEDDVWVRAIEIRPSNRAVVHHTVAVIDPDETNPVLGVDAFFSLYSPGLQPLMMPEGTAQLIPAGSTFVLQLHYVTIGYPTEDETQVALYFADEPPEHEYVGSSLFNTNIKIPAFDPHRRQKAEVVLTEDQVIQGFMPHMHYRGKEFSYVAQYPDGSKEVLLSVPNYDFNWQTFYQLEKPKLLPAGTKFSARAVYDNSEHNPFNPDPSKELRFGARSVDEMLIGYYMFTRPREVPAADDGAQEEHDG